MTEPQPRTEVEAQLEAVYVESLRRPGAIVTAYSDADRRELQRVAERKSLEARQAAAQAGSGGVSGDRL